MESPELPNQFENEARGTDRESMVGEFWSFLKQNKKWWLLPIIIVLVLIGALLVLSATAAGPFIYTLF